MNMIRISCFHELLAISSLLFFQGAETTPLTLNSVITSDMVNHKGIVDNDNDGMDSSGNMRPE